MQGYKALLCAIALSPLLAMPAVAGVVHKWVDDKGVTHYSDEPPVQAPSQVTEIALPEADKNVVADDYYSIANQWQRMHQERLEIERVRAQQAAANAGQQPSQPTVIVIEDDDDHGYAVVYGRKHHRHKRPGHPTQPEPEGGIPRNWLAQKQRGGFYAPSHKKASFY